MKIAVVMSVYNGMKFIKDQLDSIRLQTVNPDQVFIVDDQSTDETYSYVENYISNYKLTSWVLKKNETNLGWKKSFYKVIDDCDSDIIFLSDQDDVWNRHKIEIMIPYFKSEIIDVLVSKYSSKKGDIDPVYDKLEKKSILYQIFFNKKYLYGIPYPGCSFAFRKSFFDRIKPYHNDIFPHDAFIYRNALVLGCLFGISQNLLVHRIHSSNAGRATFSSIMKSTNYYKIVNKQLLQVIADTKRDKILEKNRNIIETAEKWNYARESFFYTKSFMMYIKLLKYISFYPHFKTYIKDFFIALVGS